MEEFKRLKWSWHKYEEEKKYLPRNFSFDTINDNDALSRNLNEVHTCVIPKQNEFRIFKTPEEIEANNFTLDSSGQILELKDPRTNKHYRLEASQNLINEYSYSSELTKQEQLKILDVLRNDTVHNPKILKKTAINSKRITELPKNIEEKWQKEADHFQKCAEIYYHRHIANFNDLLSNKFKELLIDKWKKLEAQIPYTNYQAITMIVRNQNSANSQTTVSHIENKPIKFDTELYEVPENYFINLQNASMDSLKLFLQCREITTNGMTANIQISLDILTKLFVNGTEFNAIFINESSSTTFILNEIVPPKIINQTDALDEAVKLHLKFNFEWYNASKCIHSSENIDFRIHSINETMSNVFKNYKNHAGANNEISLWRLECDSQKLSISVSNNNCYYINERKKVIISIKFEYQTIFGAEQMTREELLTEWIQVRFSCDACVLRYRIDAKSLEILSVVTLSIENIEKELKEMYNCNPLEALSTLFNVFNCIHNLPESRYIIQGQRNEMDCNKLLIYKEAPEHGKKIFNDEDFKVSEKFTRKWIPIDKKVSTFIHYNELIAPCCFSYKSPKKVSYIMPIIKSNKTAPIKKVVPNKSPQKLRKRKSKRKKSKAVTAKRNLK